jgi:hypothetical protein
MSGQIRKLDHRVRYHGAPSQAVSIGERMEQSIKLRKKEQKEQKESGTEEKEVKGSLSAMMNEVEKKPVNGGSDATQESTLPEAEQYFTEALTYVMPTFGGIQTDEGSESPTMMSTSLTAFEVLMSSNLSLAENNSAPMYNRSQSALFPGESEDQERLFQRSWSDPTPQYLSINRRMNDLQLNAPPPPTTAGNGWAPYTMNALSPVGEPSMKMNGVDSNHHPVGFNHAPLLNGFDYSPADHNPDIDGAFDMDME